MPAVLAANRHVGRVAVDVEIHGEARGRAGEGIGLHRDGGNHDAEGELDCPHGVGISLPPPTEC